MDEEGRKDSGETRVDSDIDSALGKGRSCNDSESEEEDEDREGIQRRYSVLIQGEGA